MRKIIIFIALALFLFPILSSEIIITNQPQKIYNIGSSLKTNLKINALQSTEGFFTIKLMCPGKETEVHKEYLALTQGQEKSISTNVPLTKQFIGPSTGTCKIKATIKEQFVLSNEFDISDYISVSLTKQEKAFEPGKSIIIEGQAKKENRINVEGFVDIKITHKEDSTGFNITDTVKNGFFQVNHTITENTKAGDYFIEAKVYEKSSSNQITNKGFAETEISIKQVPSSLEIVLEKEKIIPGNPIKIKAILHDQTGQKIPNEAIITLKDSSNRIKTQKTVDTDEFFEYLIKYNEPADEWEIVAISEKISTKKDIEITEKEDIEVNIINKTVIIKNKGNVPYNETVSIKIGNKTREIPTLLDIDEEKQYTLSAPEGEYEIRIESEGREKLSKKVMLTGKAISVEEASRGFVKIAKDPISWIAMAFVLVFIIFLVIRKKKKNFFGTIPKDTESTTRTYSKKAETKTNPEKQTPKQEKVTRKNSLIPNTENIAQLSLSMKGDHQDSNVVCLRMNNIEGIKNNLQGVQDTVQKIKQQAEKNKAYIYEGQNSLFFIFSPKATKTFDNEKNAIDLARNIANILYQHNKMYKQKINHGISINRGKIISRFNSESKFLDFMPMGNLINMLKKIASLSKGEILISQEFRAKAGSMIKTEKHPSKEMDVYRINEIKNPEEHKKFIDSFLKRQEADDT